MPSMRTPNMTVPAALPPRASPDGGSRRADRDHAAADDRRESGKFLAMRKRLLLKTAVVVAAAGAARTALSRRADEPDGTVAGPRSRPALQPEIVGRLTRLGR